MFKWLPRNLKLKTYKVKLDKKSSVSSATNSQSKSFLPLLSWPWFSLFFTVISSILSSSLSCWPFSITKKKKWNEAPNVCVEIDQSYCDLARKGFLKCGCENVMEMKRPPCFKIWETWKIKEKEHSYGVGLLQLSRSLKMESQICGAWKQLQD